MYEVKVEKLDHQGRGISHIEDKIVFIENALPGETVRIKITKQNKKIMEASVLDYIIKSDCRVDSLCPYYNECGGCDLLHLSYEQQIQYKENKIKEIMNKYAGIDNDKINQIVPCDQQYNYRNKVTLKVNQKIGYYKKKSYDIVEIEKCLLANNKINNAILEIKKNHVPECIKELVIRSVNEDEISLTIYLQKEENINNLIKKLENYFSSIKVILNDSILKQTGESNIIGRLDNFSFQMSQTAFFQVNTAQTEKLYNKVREYIKKNTSPTVLDLYCGTGTIGIYISDYAKKVTGIEINSDAIVDAKVNAEKNGVKNIDFFAGDTKELLKHGDYKADVIIVDPPRSGLDEEVITDMIKINPKEIIYVSCDSITLARDLKLFNEIYEVIEITPFDMFPNTYHVECVVKLYRK